MICVKCIFIQLYVFVPAHAFGKSFILYKHSYAQMFTAPQSKPQTQTRNGSCQTVRRVFHSTRGRWLTDREKLAASGLAVSQVQATLAGILGPVPWEIDAMWGQRVGNGQQLQNVGVVLIAALASLRIRDKAPMNLLAIEPPSFPDGLSFQDGVFFLLVGGETFSLGPSKPMALDIHKRTHAARLIMVQVTLQIPKLVDLLYICRICAFSPCSDEPGSKTITCYLCRIPFQIGWGFIFVQYSPQYIVYHVPDPAPFILVYHKPD